MLIPRADHKWSHACPNHYKELQVSMVGGSTRRCNFSSGLTHGDLQQTTPALVSQSAKCRYLLSCLFNNIFTTGLKKIVSSLQFLYSASHYFYISFDCSVKLFWFAWDLTGCEILSWVIFQISFSITNSITELLKIIAFKQCQWKIRSQNLSCLDAAHDSVQWYLTLQVKWKTNLLLES